MSVQVKLPDNTSRKFEAEIVTLPATVKIPTIAADYYAYLWPGIFFSVLGYFITKMGLADGGFYHPNTYFGLGMAAIGGASIARTIRTIRGSATLVFTQDHVEVHEAGWFTGKNWQAKYREFEGIRSRPQKLKSEKPQNGKKKNPYQIIELVHKDPTKNLPLYAARSKQTPIDHLEHYADMLDVKIIDKNMI